MLAAKDLQPTPCAVHVTERDSAILTFISAIVISWLNYYMKAMCFINN